MEIRFSNRARKLLKNKDCRQLVFYLIELETADSIGAARDIGVSYTPPHNTGQYRRANADGIDIYIDRNLRIIGPVVIKKQGFWKLSTIYADGLQIPL